ncbi:MAG: DUF4382 domain-containing protein [Gemmatimonadetes bacterium]|nr:DUF4382 domain-containing protein [Gemmatimonadota bacterium]
MRAASAALALVTIAVVSACDNPADVQTGSLMLTLTSAQDSRSRAVAALLSDGADGNVTVDAVEALNVTVDSVKVRPASGGGWVALGVAGEGGVRVNLMDLASADVTLARGELAAGDYVAARLFFTDAEIVFSEQVCLGMNTGAGATPGSVCLEPGVPHEVVIPSGEETGIKTDARFAVTEGSEETVTLVFDPEATVRSIAWARGLQKVIVAPVIRASNSEEG